MTDSTFAQRFGILNSPPVFDDFPESARIALYYLLRELITCKYVDSDDVLVTEIARIGRFVQSSRELDLELLHALEWFQCYELCERIHSRLLQEVAYRNFADQWELDTSLEDVQRYFTREINQLLWEENLGYEFKDGIFHRRGRFQTQKNVQGATGKVLADERLSEVAKYYAKARRHLDHYPNPDLENCVKDALIALEACVEIVTEQPASKDFVKTLKTLTGNGGGQIPAPIAEAMIKLHVYRGSGKGAGHAALKGNRINETDAELVLSTTAAFITYLVDLFPPEEEILF